MNVVGTSEYNPKRLVISPELEAVQNLMPMSEADRERLKDDILKNGMRHPIIFYTGYYKKAKIKYVLAGWNRREIAVELNLPEVPVQEVFGTTEEYKSFVITENLSRRHLNTEQKSELIKYLLKADPAKSDRSIAKYTGVSKSTVGEKRAELVSGGQIDHLNEIKGSDGKIYQKPEKVTQEDIWQKSQVVPSIAARTINQRYADKQLNKILDCLHLSRKDGVYRGEIELTPDDFKVLKRFIQS